MLPWGVIIQSYLQSLKTGITTGFSQCVAYVKQQCSKQNAFSIILFFVYTNKVWRLKVHHCIMCRVFTLLTLFDVCQTRKKWTISFSGSVKKIVCIIISFVFRFNRIIWSCYSTLALRVLKSVISSSNP